MLTGHPQWWQTSPSFRSCFLWFAQPGRCLQVVWSTMENEEQSEVQLWDVKWVLVQERGDYGKAQEEGIKRRKDRVLPLLGRFEHPLSLSDPQEKCSSLLLLFILKKKEKPFTWGRIGGTAHMFEHLLCKWLHWEWHAVWQLEVGGQPGRTMEDSPLWVGSEHSP